MNLRSALLMVSIVMIAGGVATGFSGRHAWAVIVWGIILLVSLLLERWRYRPLSNSGTSDEIRTGERFIDPDTGATMEVVYDTKTGRRWYVEVRDSSLL